MPYDQNSAGHEGRRCATERKTKTKIYMDTIRRYMKKNGMTDVNILDRNDWRMAVSRATH